MDKFLIAENPMRPDDSGLWVIHLLDPKAIIQCTEGHEHSGNIYSHFVYGNSDGIAEYWTLSVYFIDNSELTEKEVKQLLDRAWRWYRAYMKWEDNNIDIDEQANEN